PAAPYALFPQQESLPPRRIAHPVWACVTDSASSSTGIVAGSVTAGTGKAGLETSEPFSPAHSTLPDPCTTQTLDTATDTLRTRASVRNGRTCPRASLSPNWSAYAFPQHQTSWV